MNNVENERECCEICGDPLPCGKRRCLDILEAQADYWGEIVEGADWPMSLDAMRRETEK
jgi:hypothetical protein